MPRRWLSAIIICSFGALSVLLFGTRLWLQAGLWLLQSNGTLRILGFSGLENRTFWRSLSTDNHFLPTLLFEFTNDKANEVSDWFSHWGREFSFRVWPCFGFLRLCQWCCWWLAFSTFRIRKGHWFLWCALGHGAFPLIICSQGPFSSSTTCSAFPEPFRNFWPFQNVFYNRLKVRWLTFAYKRLKCYKLSEAFKLILIFRWIINSNFSLNNKSYGIQ
jgi:hypothetical protein